MSSQTLLTDEFRELSARLGQDPLLVQGAGGNTSVKKGDVMWVKASGTQLSNAKEQDIFVKVDRNIAKAEAFGNGKGDCLGAVLEPTVGLRPSIETTFHAVLEYSYVMHTHSVMTLVHAISPEGRQSLKEKLSGLPFAMVPYAKPGLPLTNEILRCVEPDTQIIILQNHGLICCGQSIKEVSDLIFTVEERLYMPPRKVSAVQPDDEPDARFQWSDFSWLAKNSRYCSWLVQGSYYPDHVVFLGPALPLHDNDNNPPVIMKEGVGILLRKDAGPSQQAMLRCLAEILQRIPLEWTLEPIGEKAESELLNWDAEKYRQSLAARK